METTSMTCKGSFLRFQGPGGHNDLSFKFDLMRTIYSLFTPPKSTVYHIKYSTRVCRAKTTIPVLKMMECFKQKEALAPEIKKFLNCNIHRNHLGSTSKTHSEFIGPREA